MEIKNKIILGLIIVVFLLLAIYPNNYPLWDSLFIVCAFLTGIRAFLSDEPQKLKNLHIVVKIGLILGISVGVYESLTVGDFIYSTAILLVSELIDTLLEIKKEI